MREEAKKKKQEGKQEEEKKEATFYLNCQNKVKGWKRDGKQTGNPFNWKFLKDLRLLDFISVYSKYWGGGAVAYGLTCSQACYCQF